MTTITRFTKEQLRERAREKVKSLEFAVTQNAFADSRAELEEELELARIALASLTAEPVLYAAEETLAYANMGEIHLTCLSEPMGDAVIPLYTAPPVPVVPEEMNFSTACNFVQINGMAKEDRATLAMRAWNACRAAMLQGGQPVSQTYELPELIEGMEVSIDVSTCDADFGNRYFGTVTEVSKLDTAKNGYILLVQDAKPNFDVNGNSPVSPGGWISCSERMPDNDESKPIAIFTGKCLGQGMFVATYDDDGFFDYWEGMEIIGVSHWMPLPAPPQQ